MTDLRDHLEGLLPIPARIEPWQSDLLTDHARLTDLLDRHGSPVNVVRPAALADHAADLVAAGRAHDVEVRVFFARKANKTLALVDEALAAGHGVDVASERELTQVLARDGVHDPAAQVILTAAVKPVPLLRRAVESGVVVSVDNLDELAALVEVCDELDRDVPVALRLAPDGVPPTRFGLPASTWRDLLGDAEAWRRLRLVGVHVHLSGYDAAHRVVALDQALDLVEAARGAGHAPEFVDLGGGIPMAYVDEPGPWRAFLDAHERGEEGLTWQERRLGHTYPVWQDPVRGAWLGTVLEATAERLRRLEVRLHLEPGRTLLDGCGLTLARVVQRKQGADGRWMIGLAMNRTQCRSAADDFLLDPVLVPAPAAPRTEAGTGHLVGAYCIEAELLTWRTLRFPHGVAVGDVVAFVNTAGYQMHILESASHQIPLALNLVPGGDGWRPDDIDAG